MQGDWQVKHFPGIPLLLTLLVLAMIHALKLLKILGMLLKLVQDFVKVIGDNSCIGCESCRAIDADLEAGQG